MLASVGRGCTAFLYNSGTKTETPVNSTEKLTINRCKQSRCHEVKLNGFANSFRRCLSRALPSFVLSSLFLPFVLPSFLASLSLSLSPVHSPSLSLALALSLSLSACLLFCPFTLFLPLPRYTSTSLCGPRCGAQRGRAIQVARAQQHSTLSELRYHHELRGGAGWLPLDFE